MTSDQLRDARAVCESAFAFLVEDFGYRRCRRRFQWSGFELRYCGPAMGVLIEWYPRDPLTVWLVRLIDGDFPPRSTPLRYFDLGDIEAISVARRKLDERQLYSLPTEETARTVAESLREYGADLLRGDVTRIPLLEQRIRDRYMAAPAAREGHEGFQQGS